MSEEFEVTWRDHAQATWEVFNRLRASEEFLDFEFYCGSDVLKAHKLVLIAGSRYFEKIFKTMSRSSLVQGMFMHQVKKNILEQLLAFIYVGEAVVPSDDLDSFMNLCTELEIRGLETDSSRDAENDCGGGVMDPLHTPTDADPKVANGPCPSVVNEEDDDDVSYVSAFQPKKRKRDRTASLPEDPGSTTSKAGASTTGTFAQQGHPLVPAGISNELWKVPEVRPSSLPSSCVPRVTST